MTLSAGMAAIGQCPQALVEILHLGAAQGDALHRCTPGWGQLRGTQQDAGMPIQGIDKHLLGLAVDRVAPVMACKPARAARYLPVGGAVTSTGEAGGVDEGFGQQEGMTVNPLPIRRETAQIQRQHPRGQIGQMGVGQDQKPGIVGQQMQTLIVQHPWPTDPGIARAALERRRLPAEQGKPAFIGHGDVTQRLAEQ